MSFTLNLKARDKHPDSDVIVAVVDSVALVKYIKEFLLVFYKSYTNDQLEVELGGKYSKLLLKTNIDNALNWELWGFSGTTRTRSVGIVTNSNIVNTYGGQVVHGTESEDVQSLGGDVVMNLMGLISCSLLYGFDEAGACCIIIDFFIFFL